MKWLWKIGPWLLVALFGVEIVVVMWPKQDGEYHTQEFGRLPVLLSGRIQPFDSVGRNALLQIRSTGDVPLELVPSWKFWHHPMKLKATEWLLEVISRPDEADKRSIFLIHHSELLGELKLQDKGIEKSGLRYYTFNDLKALNKEIEEQARKAGEVKDEQRTAFQKQVLKLANAVMLYSRLKFTLQPAGVENFAHVLEEFQKDLGPARAAAQASEAGKPFDPEAFKRISEPIRGFQMMAEYGYARVVPPPEAGAPREQWQTVGHSLSEMAHGAPLHPAVKNFAAMATAYGQQQPEAFNRALAEYGSWLAGRFPAEVRKGAAECYFNQVKAFLHATIIYVFAFVAAGIALLTFGVATSFSEAARRTAFYLVILAGLVHTFGLVFRMVLEGRPPVTNLYSSAIFIGWGTMVLGLILERIYRVGIGSAVGAFTGFVTLLIAHNLALGGDTMEMLRAVLDTNFWLATHVVVITLGYAATFAAGLLAILYIFLGLGTRLLTQKVGQVEAGARGAGASGGLQLSKALTKMVYGIVCFATLFSFLGTVLGGIWADQSWGRFWGWDPKENGALLIVLWNAIILHARWGGLVRERGLMNLAVFGNIVTSFSWFGVNMLGIGLHSYGFMDAAFKWLMMFVVSQMLIIGDGMLPKLCWRNEEVTDAEAGKAAAMRWIALGFNGLVVGVGLVAGFSSVWCLLALALFFVFVLLASLIKVRVTPASPTAPSSAEGKGASPVPAT